VVEGKTVLISVDRSEVIVLNEVATEIWNFLEKQKTDEEIVEYLTDSFDCDEETARKDLSEFIQRLTAKEVLCVE